MLLSFVRAIILYVIVLIVMRTMGKREIGQLEPFELAISIMIADLACTPMANPRASNIFRNNSYFSAFSNAFSYCIYKYKKY